jgi:hypothetical protein
MLQFTSHALALWLVKKWEMLCQELRRNITLRVSSLAWRIKWSYSVHTILQLYDFWKKWEMFSQQERRKRLLHYILTHFHTENENKNDNINLQQRYISLDSYSFECTWEWCTSHQVKCWFVGECGWCKMVIDNWKQ